MAFEIDHLFICTETGAPEADRLLAFGLLEGKPNTHPGQGTACRRFFFANAYLELLWVQSPIEAQSEQSRRTRLWERWSGRRNGACPFGICVRPSIGHQRGECPFGLWEYRPSYMPGVSLGIAKNSETITEPFLCYLPPGQRPDSYAIDRQQPFRHAAGLREITKLMMTSPKAESRSPEFQAAVDGKLIDEAPGDQHCLELGFDREEQANYADFRPELPLVFRW